MRRTAIWQRAITANWVLITACVGALLLLFFLSLATDRGFAQNARLRQDVSNSYDARAALQGVLTRHQDIELGPRGYIRSEEHTSELQSLMRIPYAVFCLQKKK